MKYLTDLKHMITIYYCVVNFYGWFLVRSDKRRSQGNKWRIPEKRFFLLALFGGGFGIYAGMKRYRHKTKHKSFRWGIPFFIIVHIGLIFYILKTMIL